MLTPTMLSRRSAFVVLSSVAAVSVVRSPARADECHVMDSMPAASAVIGRRSSEFFVRFDRPVDHRHSTLDIERDGKVVERLQPRLGSAPDVLFARAPTLDAGQYQLHWAVRTLTGTEVTHGLIPFAVKD
jgi:methionine-rich copper-binding protein CopC